MEHNIFNPAAGKISTIGPVTSWTSEISVATSGSDQVWNMVPISPSSPESQLRIMAREAFLLSIILSQWSWSFGLFLKIRTWILELWPKMCVVRSKKTGPVINKFLWVYFFELWWNLNATPLKVFLSFRWMGPISGKKTKHLHHSDLWWRSKG